MNVNEFKDNVRGYMITGNGLSFDEFERLVKQYDSFGFLVKYALRSWMAAEAPELTGPLSAGGDEGWQLYRDAGGAVQH